MPEQNLYTAAHTRELDRVAIEECGIPGIRLMSRAGRAAFELVQATWPEACPLVVFCGTGNNGGDGFVVAALAQDRGVPVTVYQVGDDAKISGDAATARQAAVDAGVEIQPFDPALEPDSCVIVDALLGTGLSGDVRGDYATAIEAINRAGAPVLAIDIPSGLCSDTGRRLGVAVKADATITFIGVKQGLLTGDAPDCCGELHFADLGVPADVYDQVPVDARRLDLDRELDALPGLAVTAHKGAFGHALVIGGDLGMAGAALMAAEAAGRCGAGLVSAATRAIHVPALLSRRPEVMAHGVESRGDLDSLLEKASAVTVGPGLGQGAWSEQMLQNALDSDLPLVVDADALNMLARRCAVSKPERDNWILTPHPGEAARLLGSDTATVQRDRFAAVRALQSRYGGVVLLKGAGTLVCDGETVYVCPYGNPGMASGGMGDVLSGVLVALLAQGLGLRDAACLGACLHAAAADLAAGNGMRGMLATDLMPFLRGLLDD
jgi:NAD(P)H-hydrate epimerase